VTLTVTDASGNSSTATAIVRVVDRQGPTFSKEPITVYVSGRRSVGLTRTQVTSRVSDNCALGSVSIPRRRFTRRNEGLNRVRVTARDRSGNTTAGTVFVNVVDISHLGTRIQICFKGRTIRVRPQWLQSLIDRGASFGSCNSVAPQATPGAVIDQETVVEPEITSTEPLIELSAYPNPVKSVATITFSSNRAGRSVLTIFNSGKPSPVVLFDQDIEANTNQKVTFDTSDLPVGVYILRLRTAQGVKTMKLLVRR